MNIRLPARLLPCILLCALAVTLPAGCAVVGVVAAAHPLLAVGAGAVVGVGGALLSDRGQSQTSDDLAPLPNLAALKGALHLTNAQVVQIAPLLAEIDQTRQMAAAAQAKAAKLNASLPMDVAAHLTRPQQLELAQMVRGPRGQGFSRRE